MRNPMAKTIPSILNPREFLVETGQLSIDDISYILHSAERLSSLTDYGQWKPLAGRRCVLLFTQPSTRTFTSFSFAAQSLGMSVADVRELGLTGVAKGERISDVLMTLARNADLLVVRDGDSETCKNIANCIVQNNIRCRVISAGTGMVEHPTQALCDLLITNRYHNLARSAPKNVLFVGDVRRGRTALSFSCILSNWTNWQQNFFSVGDLAVPPEVVQVLSDRGVTVHILEKFDDAPPDVDVIYMMRNQKEYSGSLIGDMTYAEVILTKERLKRFSDDVIVLHPLPRGNEVPDEIDADASAKYWEVVDSAQCVRKALIAWMFGKKMVD